MRRLAPRSTPSTALCLALAAGCTHAPAPGPTPSGNPVEGPTEEPAEGPADFRAQPSGTLELDHPGCFLLLDLQQGTPLRGGRQPCNEPTIPASTFKIPHSLIALDTGVVADPSAPFVWDGTEYPGMPSWQRDHDLPSALYHSVVWVYQHTAREIGRERMREYLEAFDYGNARVEGPIDLFWLGGGSLEISPEQSLDFMAALYRDELPRAQEHLPRLREMLVRPPSSFSGRMPKDMSAPELHEAATFSAKTGTGRHEGGSVSWLVGHVACPQRQHVFVSRVIAEGPPGRISPAVAHGISALDELGVLRCEAPS